MQTFDCFLKSNFAPKTFLSFLAFVISSLFKSQKWLVLNYFNARHAAREREREKEKEKKRKIDIKRGKVSWRER